MLNTSLGEELLSEVGAYVWLQEILPCSFPKWLQQFTCPTTGTGIFSLFYSRHSGRCAVVSQWGSNLHIPDDPGVMALPMLAGHLEKFFCEAESWVLYFWGVKTSSVDVNSSRLYNLRILWTEQAPLTVLWQNLLGRSTCMSMGLLPEGRSFRVSRYFKNTH